MGKRKKEKMENGEENEGENYVGLVFRNATNKVEIKQCCNIQ